MSTLTNVQNLGQLGYSSGSPPNWNASQSAGSLDARSETPAAPAPQLTEADKAQLDAALKKAGIKTEIQINQSGYTIVRYVDPETSQLMYQIPNQTVLDLLAQIKSASNNAAAPSGALLDRLV